MFRREYGHEFDYQDYGCTSLSEFCLLQPNVFELSRTKADGLVYPAGHGGPPAAAVEGGEGDQVHGDEVIPEQKLPDDEDMFDVTVEHVYDPGRFYFQLLGKATSGALHKIMAEMKLFYNSAEGRALKMKSADMLVGRYCAAKYKGDWSRAVVKSLKDFATVVVSISTAVYMSTAAAH
jgi:hypothetical protein